MDNGGSAFSIPIGDGFTRGKDANGEPVVMAMSGVAVLTTSVLAANGKWSTGWIDTNGYIGAETTLYSDVDGSYTLRYSDDAGATESLPSIPLIYTTSQKTRKGQFPVSARYIKFDYVNGGTAQTKFKFQLTLLTQPAQSSAETLSATGSDTRVAAWTKARIETKTSDGTNDYAPIYRLGNALLVHVVNQPSGGGAATDVSALATHQNQTNGTQKTQIVNGNNQTLGTQASPLRTDPTGSTTQPVSVTNFPATQPVTVSNFPATQPVSGSVNVTNFPTDNSLTNTQLRASAVDVKQWRSTATPTVTRVTSVTTAATILAANTARIKAIIYNESTSVLILKFGTAPTTTSYTVRVLANGTYEVPLEYTGIITGMWVAANGGAQVTEF